MKENRRLPNRVRLSLDDRLMEEMSAPASRRAHVRVCLAPRAGKLTVEWAGPAQRGRRAIGSR
jgi:hypothetical protein